MAYEQARPLATRFLSFMNKTGSPYHTVAALKEGLIAAGFQELDEGKRWDVRRAGRYFVTRNGSSIAAFVIGKDFAAESSGFCITATHTDSPCLRLRPRAYALKEGYEMGNVECYGGGLWHTWFDRGLGIAGKVILKTGEKIAEKLVRIPRPLFFIPNLAIHLQTAEEIAAFKVNKEKHLQPILCSSVTTQLLAGVEPPSGDDIEKCRLPPSLEKLLVEELNAADGTITDWDICLMDSTPSRFCGIYEEFIESPRLDNHYLTFGAFEAMLGVTNKQSLSESGQLEQDILVSVAFDHEEVGSRSSSGANSSVLETWLRRLAESLGDERALPEIFSRSFLISADMAHAVHPNYSEKHQEQHKPRMQQGVTLKENANQCYASNASTMAIVRAIAAEAEIPVQEFVVRNDSRCGGTVGPFLSAHLGVRTADVGAAQLAMHSCREVCGVNDLLHFTRMLETFYSTFRKWDSTRDAV